MTIESSGCPAATRNVALANIVVARRIILWLRP